jgi:hypothetical protein
MRSLASGLVVLVLFAGAVLLDGGTGPLPSLAWIIAWADFLLIGYLLGWVLARLAPDRRPPMFRLQVVRLLQEAGRPRWLGTHRRVPWLKPSGRWCFVS